MLARIRKAQEENEGGFTLIELLVVIIIIGILAAIAIPVFLNQRKKGVDASMKSDARTIANELETYYTDYQTYPAATTTTTSGSIAIGGDTPTLSPGNSVTIFINAAVTAYCVTVTNVKGSHNWIYQSDIGGLQPAATTACPSNGSAF